MEESWTLKSIYIVGWCVFVRSWRWDGWGGDLKGPTHVLLPLSINILLTFVSEMLVMNVK
jgi:hypothetical protein